jgi:carbon-monoxide dehydrogenase large subunit
VLSVFDHKPILPGTATGVAREPTEMTVDPDGFIDVVIGVSSQGQGHETRFAQLVGEWFDVPIERVRLGR